MKKLSLRFAVSLCLGTLFGTLANTLFVLPVRAGTEPVIQNFSSLTTTPGFRGLLSDPLILAKLKEVAQAKLAELRAGGANSQLLARFLVSPTPSDQAQLAKLFQSLGISSESSAALLEVLAGLLSETTTTSSRLQTLPVSVLDSGSGLLSRQTRSLSVLGVNPLVADVVPTASSTTVNVNTDKLVKAIAIYNLIIDESSPQVLAALAQNSDFKAISETLRNLRGAIG
ncbi:hypothetical protein TUMEXPCC7403_01185 [Tumidithrix helvetica PCC 7403]|uniref:hypothetical protein n=1 Tax=Tumidithrix helvetica TaxID=3457545 RepID=UPI003C8F2B40